MKPILRIGMIFAVMATAWGATAAYAEWAYVLGKDGDGVPTPNDLVNQYTELADGESYELYGRIELREMGGAARGVKYAVLVIDLRQHPWLGGPRRRFDRSYQLQGPATKWQSLEGRSVRLRVIAHGAIQKLRAGAAPRYIMSLQVEAVDAL